jgi:hypothetical protein
MYFEVFCRLNLTTMPCGRKVVIVKAKYRIEDILA